ncbi:MAG TPA: sensor domain-containing diguanylate cyclase [Pyrinomonadaceae bacterium]|nr:sensor domain-containing diguanylate cyclase [Pyrinomonadaceae bacterium]
MPNLEKRPPVPAPAEMGPGAQATLIFFGLAAPVATYIIAISSLSQDTKVLLLVGLSLVYLTICIWTIVQLRRIKRSEGVFAFQAPAEEPEDDIDNRLAALEDAREFFGSSLKPADMFRLVSNRVGEIVPLSACVLFVKNSETGMLRAANCFGANSAEFENVEISADSGLAGLSLLNCEIETADDLKTEAAIFPAAAVKGFGSSAAIPLGHQGEVFAVFQMFFADAGTFDDEALERFEEIGERIAPLFLGTLALEKSLSNALTDPLTRLPNERAFHMVLENQLAESHRYRDERPLTVLAIDIKNFEELNRDHGHAFGDRALSFAAEKISTQLRKMDFLARSMNDEFMVVLPKASERTANEIVNRIRKSLADSALFISEEESIKVWLNFGSATFWADGETSQQLIQNANVRKQQSKLEDPGNLIWFPKEYVN